MSREIDELKNTAGAYRRWALEARKKYIELRLRQDPEIRGLYIRAADRVAKELRSLALKTPSSYLRKRQLEELEKVLRAEAERIAEGMTKALQGYIEKAVGAGAGYSTEVVLDLFRKAELSTQSIHALFAQINRQAVEACWARTRKGLFLSDRIWQQGESFRKTMRDMVQESVAIGQDAVKTARMLERYVRTDARTLTKEYPNMMERMAGRVPGNLSYEALRLVRTETTAAFGEGTIAAARVSPSYIGLKWILSKSHPVHDICDELAAHDEGLGRGVYAPGNEPTYPAHPNELCVLVPVHEQPEKFVERLKRWNKNPSSEPELEKWYNTLQGKGLTVDHIAENVSFTKVLRDKEKEIVNRTTEKCFVFDSKGTVIFEKVGTSDKISFTKEEVFKFTDNVFTHNHPRGSSFSDADIYLAMKCNLKEIRAVGKMYRYSMIRPIKGWSEDLWTNIVEPSVKKHHAQVYKEFTEAIRLGKMTIDEAELQHWHEVWSRVAKEVGLDYSRESW